MWIRKRDWVKMQDDLYYQQRELEGLYKRVYQHEEELRWFRDHFKDLEERVIHIEQTIPNKKVLHG